MDSHQQEFAKEQAHLIETIEIVKNERVKSEISLGIKNGNDRTILVNNDGGGDAIVEQLVMRTRLRGLHQLRLSEKQPYFARLDFTPDIGSPVLGELRAGQCSSVYIGRWGVLQTPEYKIRIVDWRSPVANLYYSGQVGRVSYEAPDGAVAGDLSLKRMFTIEDDKLAAMQDTGLVGQERFLTDALSQVTTARLREVVTTIQAEQNTVIRYDPMRPLCVQGVAGSGKTTIALHRIAWILYRLQKTIAPPQLLILAPNPLFLSYISRVLPDLGVNEVQQVTFVGLCERLIDKHMPKLTLGARLCERLDMNKSQRDSLDDVLKRKGALSLRAKLTRFLAQWEQSCIPTQDVKLSDRVLIAADELRRYFLTDFRHFPLVVRVGEVRKVVTARLKRMIDSLLEALEKKVEERLDALLRSMPDGDERRARAKKLFDGRDERLAQMKQLQKSFLKEYDMLWGSMDLLTVYAAFWRDMALRDAENQPVLDATLPLIAKKRVACEDLPALLLLAQGLYGFKRMDIKHVVIDEAQDVAPLQVKALRELFNHDAFTLVGDLCQGIYGDEGIRSWGDLSDGIFDQNLKIAQLSTAYRSTVEIMEVAFSVIARHPMRGAGLAKPVLRHGEKPTLTVVKDEKERAATTVAIVKNWLKEGYGGIAILTKTEPAAKALHKLIAKTLPEARLITHGDDTFLGGVQVMDASVVKGLEFDCMLVADADAVTYPDERFYAKLFYVLCTRPLHRLSFLCIGEATKLQALKP